MNQHKDKPIDYRALLRELIAIWDGDLVARSRSVKAEGKIATPVLIRGLVAHAVDCARGILALYEAAIPIVAVPVIRLLIEDSITAGWILVTPDGWKLVLGETADQRRKAMNDLLEDNPNDPVSQRRLVEYAKAVDELGISGQYSIVKQRIESLVGTDNVYHLYRFVTWFSHAGGDIVDRYTAPRDDPEMPVVWRKSAAHPTAATLLGVAAVCLLQALIAWDSVLAEPMHEQELDAIARRLGVRSRWERRQR